MKNRRKEPQVEPSSLTSHHFIVPTVFPIKVPISSFIHPIGKLCKWTQNNSFEKSSFETGIQPSNSLRESRDDSKSQGLCDITHCRSSRMSNVKIKVFKLISNTEYGLETLYIFSVEFWTVSLFIDRSTCSFPIILISPFDIFAANVVLSSIMSWSFCHPCSRFFIALTSLGGKVSYLLYSSEQRKFTSPRPSIERMKEKKQGQFSYLTKSGLIL